MFALLSCLGPYRRPRAAFSSRFTASLSLFNVVAAVVSAAEEGWAGAVEAAADRDSSCHNSRLFVIVNSTPELQKKIVSSS